MRGQATRDKIEKEFGADVQSLLVTRLRQGVTLIEVAREWGVCTATIYSLARQAGLDLYWVRDGVDVVAKMP